MKVHASLHIRTVSLENSLLAHTKYGKIKSHKSGLLSGCTHAFEKSLIAQHKGIFSNSKKYNNLFLQQLMFLAKRSVKDSF